MNEAVRTRLLMFHVELAFCVVLITGVKIAYSFCFAFLCDENKLTDLTYFQVDYLNLNWQWQKWSAVDIALSKLQPSAFSQVFKSIAHENLISGTKGLHKIIF